MKRVSLFALAGTIVLLALFVGCGPAAIEAERYDQEFAPLAEEPGLPPPVQDEAKALPTAVMYGTGGEEPSSNISTSDRMIIKNAEIKMQVADTDVTIDLVTQVVGDLKGYTISSRQWFQSYYGQNYKYASITIAVPADQFENTLRRLRGLAVQVLDEQASGEDVTDQYVDYESRLRNLEATRDRIMTFLERAQTVDQALQVNQELANIEQQIEETRGRMNYLSGRAAFSTISISLEPKLPEITPTPTPTRTPRPWEPDKTFNSASNTLVVIYQFVVDMLIWILVVLLPIIAPPILIIWLIWWLVQRRKKRIEKPTKGSKGQSN